MLQRIENVTVVHERGLLGMLTGRGRLVISVGHKRFVVPEKVHKYDVARTYAASLNVPVCYVVVGERSYWLFDDRWYWDDEGLSADQVHDLIVSRAQRRQAMSSRARSAVATGHAPTRSISTAIPEDAKQLVWTLDRGRCRQCGSTTGLQLDYIVPQSLGGASIPENLQVLCGPCRRRKSASGAAWKVR